jgi:uncharacterized protein
MKTIRIAIAVLLVLAVAALAGVGRPEAAESAGEGPQAGITVTGTGEVRQTPDRASLMFGIQTEGETADKAHAANSAATRQLIAALKAAGVEPKDLKTEHLDVSPRWDVDKVAAPRGYTANSMVTVSNQPLARASRLSDIAVDAGADTVSGPALSVADSKAEYRRALERAFEDAREKANTLAAAAGASLGKVTAIAEGSQPRPYFAMAELRAADAEAPIEPGSEQVTAVVTVTFAIG